MDLLFQRVPERATSQGTRNQDEWSQCTIPEWDSREHYKGVIQMARTMMLHANLRWPEVADESLWPHAL